MRIIAGEWRRRPLQAPPGEATRPTADRARETLFSMLTSRLGGFEGLSVADLFAGSGALGLEALSRGAASCLFVEQDPAAIRALRANIAALRAQQRCDVRATSVLQLGSASRPIDLLLLDPPYGTGAGAVARMLAAALAGAAAGWGVRFLLPEMHPIPTAVLVLGTYGIVYFAVAAALRLEEIHGVITRIRGLRGR